MQKESRLALVTSTVALALALLVMFRALPDLNVFNRPISARTFIVEDANGRTRIILTTVPDDAPSVSLLDSAGTVRAEMSLTPTDIPGLVLLSSTGKSMLTASLRTRGGHPELTLQDSEGRLRWRIWLNENGDPEIRDMSSQ